MWQARSARGRLIGLGATVLALAGGQQWAQAQRYVPCASPDRPILFPTYWAGPAFDELRLSTVIWECSKPLPDEPIRLHGPTYIYTNCDPFDAGCEYVDVQIYSTPSTERNKGSLD